VRFSKDPGLRGLEIVRFCWSEPVGMSADKEHENAITGRVRDGCTVVIVPRAAVRKESAPKASQPGYPSVE